MRDADVERVIDAAKAVAIPLDREILHVLPQEYIIDDQDGISEPLGMAGVRLEAKVHIVTAAVDLGAEHHQVLQPLRPARRRHRARAARLGERGARRRREGARRRAGRHRRRHHRHRGLPRRRDRAHRGARRSAATSSPTTSRSGCARRCDEAEKIKQRFGCALASSMVTRTRRSRCRRVGGRAPRVLPRQILGEIIEPRVEEIFALVRARW